MNSVSGEVITNKSREIAKHELKLTGSRVVTDKSLVSINKVMMVREGIYL